MSINNGRSRPRRARWLASGGLAAGAAVLLAACGSSTPGTASTGTSTTTGNPTTTSKAAAGVTISAANVPGFGTVLVNGQGRTLYLLNSEAGGKLTCTDSNGCTAIWPDTELPQGVATPTAGSGIQAGLLSTVKDAKGALYVTYGGWPLYSYSGDSASAQANGEGITSFGGTWYVIGTNGQPVKARTQAGGSSGTSGGSGY